MTKKAVISWFLVLSALFIALNAILVANDNYFLLLLPFGIALFALGFLAIDKLLLLIALLVPLSLNWKIPNFGSEISLPTEPLLIYATLIFLAKIIIEGSFDTRFFKHPVTLAVFGFLAWVLITSFTSEIPVVSFKAFAAQLWLIIPCFFLGYFVFQKTSNIKWFYWLYVLTLSIVIVRTLIVHGSYGFTKRVAYWAPEPFFNDHTQYGAVLGLFFPFIVGFTLINRFNLFFKICMWLLTALFVVALYYSISRAAWLSIIGALGILMVFALRIKASLIVGVSAVIGLFLALNWTDIVMKLEKNKQDSSGKFSEHVKSMSNISTDASNLERLLRWNAAIRLFKERPVTGWGPGTYTFVYAPYQMSYEKTIISTNFGDGGNAHSEYLGPMAERGVLGVVTYLIVIITTFFTGRRIILGNYSYEVKQLAMITLLGLITYWIHGVLNNFLDSDKAAVPYWAFTAMLVSLEIFHQQKSKTKEA